VTNAGTRPCAGTVTVPAPYRAAPFATGVVAPGATVTSPAVAVAHDGPPRAEDIITAVVSAPGDANPANDRAAAHVVFEYCDVGARLAGAPGAIPTEGKRRFEVVLRNAGTAPCRVRVGSGSPYVIQPGRSASDHVAVAAPRGARVRARVNLTLRASAEDDVRPADNSVTVAPTVVRVGDSAIRRATSRSMSGTASKGLGALRAASLRPARVDVAVLRADGRRCSWLRSSRGGFLRSTSRAACASPRWIRASGTTKWRLALRAALPAGRYVVFSRATIKAGFPEARFTRADGNRVPLRVR
jgi:hypothetical protein